MYEDLLVNGTALSTIGAIVSFDGIRAEAPLRGSNITIPGVAGDHYIPKVRGAYVFTVPMLLTGASLAALNDKIESLRVLMNSGSSALALVRHYTTAGGGGTVSQSASGDYLSGLEPNIIGWANSNARIALDIVNLSGGWT